MRISVVISTPLNFRSRIFSPGRSKNSGLSFLRRSQTTNPNDGTVWTVAETVTTCSREISISSPAWIGSSVQGSRPRSMRLKYFSIFCIGSMACSGR